MNRFWSNKLGVFLLFLQFSSSLMIKVEAIEEFPEMSKNDHLKYNQLFPYYFDTCVITQMVPRKESALFERGGIEGHAVAFLHGACLQDNSKYPSLKLCDFENNKNFRITSDTGVGITVNPRAKNMNWIGIEGRELFFRGNLDKNERLTKEYFEKFRRKLKDRRFIRSIKFDQRFFSDKPEGMSDLDYFTYNSVGTDIGLTFGRKVYCSRIPLNQNIMKKVIDFFNQKNQVYYETPQDYRWDLIYDNCSHLLHNAMAYADVYQEKEVFR